MEIFLLIVVTMLVCVVTNQQKQIKELEDRTLLSLKLICKKMKKETEENINGNK